MSTEHDWSGSICWRGLEPYERAADDLAAGREHAALLREIREDFRRRCLQPRFLAPGPARPDGVVGASTNRLEPVAILLCIAAVVGALLFDPSKAALAILASLGVGMVMVCRHVGRRTPRHGRILSLPDECGQCQYPILGVPDGLPEKLLGIHVGPRRCPECGYPWPRIPGPMG